MKINNRKRPDTSALLHVGLDAVLSRGELERLALHTDVVDVPDGEVLCRSGETPRQFLVVVDGYVDIFDRFGGRRIGGPGTRIGGAELLDEYAHDQTVVTRSTCRLVVIFGPALRSADLGGTVAGWLGHQPHTTTDLALVS